MLDINLINAETRQSLLKRGHNYKQINCMTPEEAFHEYCNWHGLVNWGHTLLKVYSDLKAAEQVTTGGTNDKNRTS